MFPSDIDPKVKIRSLTVREVKDLAMVDFEREDPVKFINTLMVKCSSLSMLQNNIIGGLIRDILKVSGIEFSEETEETLERISSIGRSFPHVFGSGSDRPDLREEIESLYIKLADDIQFSIKELNKDFLKIFKETSIQPSELDKLQYWEYKYYLQML